MDIVERQFHVIMVLEVERQRILTAKHLPTSDERAFLPSSDSGWKMLDTCSISVSPIQQPDSLSFARFAAYRGNLRSPRREHSQRSDTQALATWG